MNKTIGKAPFLRLLLPVVIAIILSPSIAYSRKFLMGISIVGFLLIFASFFYPKSQQFKTRWFFGAGTFLFLFALTLFRCHLQSEESRFNFSDNPNTYLATILETPSEKRRSFQVPVKTAPPDEKIVMIYLEKNDLAMSLTPGEEIIFTLRPTPFNNLGNPGEWDYAAYMKNRGFSASGYLPANAWQKTGRKKITPFIMAQSWREKALRFYQSLGLQEQAYAFIVAITLGDKSYLQDEIKETFRASGTAHLLAVSGLHTGIIYMIFSLLLYPLGKKRIGFIIKQCLIILMLYGYAFIAGLAPSVIRAVIMLSLYLIGKIRHETSFTINTLAIAAFMILIFRPFSLFDIGFQMSFTAVASILWFQPQMLSIIEPRNRVTTYLWKVATLSFSAQIGIFPIVLHYFGTFPTWFFISNLIAVPLMGVIIYTLVPTLFVLWLQMILPTLHESLVRIPQKLIQLLTDAMFHIVKFIESLPFSQFKGLYISLPSTILILLSMFLFSLFLKRNQVKTLILSLLALLSFQIIVLKEEMQAPPPRLVVFNSYNLSDIALYSNHTRYPINIPINGLLPHPHKVVLKLSDNRFEQFTADKPFPVDVLILSHHCSLNTEKIHTLFKPSLIVIDSSIPRNIATRVSNQCEEIGIAVHDVRRKGAFSLNF